MQTFAQNTKAAVQAQLNSIFSNIDKSQIPLFRYRRLQHDQYITSGDIQYEQICVEVSL